MTTTAPFDRIASRYDALWTHTPVGRAQRNQVWRVVDQLFQSGDRVLDLGCGTGEDARHLERRGVRVLGIDASAEMVRMAVERGVAAAHIDIEELDTLDGEWDGALSNFGAVNCIADAERVAASLARLIRPAGHVLLCVMNRTCAWEMAHFAVRGQWAKAFRRLRRSGAPSSFGAVAHYYSAARIRRAFEPAFRLVSSRGVGLLVPPSYVKMSPALVRTAERVDSALSSWPVLRAVADHRLYVFERSKSC